MLNTFELNGSSPRAELAVLAFLAPALWAAAAAATPSDRYLDIGPLGGKPKVVESVEGFLMNADAGGFTATHSDYPNQLTQLVGAAATGFPDEVFPVDRRAVNHRFQRDGGAGDFDGNGVEGTVVALQTSQQALPTLPGVPDIFAHSIQIVLSEEGSTHSVMLPGLGGREDGSTARDAVLPPAADMDPGPTRHYDRSLRLAVGQLDDDPGDEIVVAYWTSSETIQLVVLDLADTNSDGLGDALQVFSLRSSRQEGTSLADLTIGRGGSTGRSSLALALAVGDYDGDLVDEIALVYPNAHVDLGLIEGFNSAQVAVYEFTGEATGQVFVTAALGQTPGFVALTGAIVPSGGGAFDVPFPGTTGSLIPAGTHPSGTAVRVKRMIATAANLPYTPDPAIDRLGAPRESLVVGIQMHQENLSQKWVLPGALVWLRPSRFAGDCSVPTNGDTEYCLTNTQPVLNHARVETGNYNDNGSTLPSTLCMDAGNLRDDPANPGESGRDEITFMYDPHLFVMRAVVDGADRKSSSGDMQSLVNADPDGTCSGLPNQTETGGACVGIGAYNRNTSGQAGQQCSLAIADTNGHQDLQTQGGVLSPEILLDLREAQRLEVGFITIDATNAFVIEVSAADLSRNDAHQHQYVALGTLELTAAFALFADIDGDNVFLTEPVNRYTVGVDQPLVFLGAPPVHFDEIGGGEIDPANCFPGFSCPFTAEYTTASEQASTLSHSYSADWYVSNTTSGCVGDCTFGLGAKAEFSLTTAYGEQFSSTSSSTITGGDVSARDTLAGVDESLVEDNSYEVWEYGILCDEVDGVACDPDDTIAVVVPSVKGALFDAWPRPDVDLGTYAMTHEGGNLLSYKSKTDMLSFLDGIDSVYTGPSPTSFGVAATPTSTKFISISETSQTDDTKGSIFSIDGTVSASGSIGIVEASTSFSGGYSTSDFVSKQARVSQTDSLLVTLGQLPSNNDRYSVTPVAYLRNGAFVLDYAVDGPSDCFTLDPACVKSVLPNSFWAMYADDPDPSFRLPLLRDVEKGLGDNTGDRTRRTTEILIEPVDQSGDQEPGDPAEAVKPGARVELRTRVHNYSLVDLNSQTQVTFYDADPDQGGGAIGSQQILSIPARGTVEIPNSVVWDIPEMSQAQFDAARVYARLQTTANEIHLDNNVAWRSLSRGFVPEPSTVLSSGAALAVLALLSRARRARGAASRGRQAGREA